MWCGGKVYQTRQRALSTAGSIEVEASLITHFNCEVEEDDECSGSCFPKLLISFENPHADLAVK